VKELLCGVLLFFSGAHAEELPVYPGSVHTRIGDDLIIDGECFRIAYFITDDEMTKVAEYFLGEWNRRGYPAGVDGDPRVELVVSAFYTRQGLQRSVILRPHLGRTLGFSVLRDLWITPDDPRPPLPVLENTLFSHRLTSLDLGRAENQSAVVEADFAEVSVKVAAELKRAGYALVKQHAGTAGGKRRLTYEHRREGDHVSTVVTEVEPKLTAVVQTGWLSRGAPGEDSHRRNLNAGVAR